MTRREARKKLGSRTHRKRGTKTSGVHRKTKRPPNAEIEAKRPEKPSRAVARLMRG